MPWWATYTIVASVLLMTAKGRDKAQLSLLVCGLLFVQVWKSLDVGDAIWICFAASWVLISSFMLAVANWRHGDTKNRRHYAIAALTLTSAMCYFAGRVLGLPFAASVPVYHSALFWADMALVGAILVAGGPGFVSSIRNLGDSALGRSGSRGAVNLARGSDGNWTG